MMEAEGKGEGRNVQTRICYRNGREEAQCTGVGGGEGRYMKPSEWSMWGTEERKRKEKKDNTKEARDPKEGEILK
jgi:hypothetical protein